MTGHPRFLMTPGPLALDDDVKAQMLLDLGSRDQEFTKITAFLRGLLLELINGGDTHSVIPIQGSGTYGIESAIASFIEKHEKPLVCVNGIYGERILKILELRGISAVVIRSASDKPVSVDAVKRALIEDKKITHLCFVHCETTTGIVNPLSELVEVSKQLRVKTIIDAMSSFGAIEIDAKKSPFDVLITSANKCVEGPPGVAFIFASMEELRREHSLVESYVLDARDQWRNFESSGEWRTTPPTHIIQACKKAVELLMAEGVARRGDRYKDVKQKIIKATEKYASPLLSCDLQSPVCLSLTAKGFIESQADFQKLYDHLSNSNIYIYAKLHQQTQSFRIGCIGSIKPDWITKLSEAFESFFSGADMPRKRGLSFSNNILKEVS